MRNSSGLLGGCWGIGERVGYVGGNRILLVTGMVDRGIITIINRIRTDLFVGLVIAI